MYNPYCLCLFVFFEIYVVYKIIHAVPLLEKKTHFCNIYYVFRKKLFLEMQPITTYNL